MEWQMGTIHVYYKTRPELNIILVLSTLLVTASCTSHYRCTSDRRRGSGRIRNAEARQRKDT